MTDRRALAAFLLAASIATGCKDDSPRASPAADEQSFDQAMRIVCDAPEQAELGPDSAGSANQAMVLATWIDRRVHNREARQLIAGNAAQTPEGKLDALQAGAKRAGLARCPLAEMWRASLPPEAR